MTERFDVVVIGAGPAGTAAAIEAAARGASTLLLERHVFPRSKVCGGCLGPRALACLERVAVDPTRLAGARRLDRVLVRIGTAEAGLPLAEGVAVDRTELDRALLQRAAAAGVAVIEGTRAQVDAVAGDRRIVRFGTGAGEREVAGRIVLDATGLPTAGAAAPGDARVGLGQRRIAAAGPPPGEVWMLSGARGYVGMVRFADGSLNVAASVRADALEGGAGAAVDEIVAGAGVEPLGWSRGWRGTRPLRRVRTGPPRERLLPIGDAAGFWEPFTGEGIGWALESGVAAVDPALQLGTRWSDAAARDWSVGRRRWMRRVQRRSRAVGWLAEHPWVARAALPLLGASGRLSRWAVPAARPRFASAIPGVDRGAP